MGLLSFLGIGKKEESNLEGFKIPEFQEDPDYRETQDYLKTLGIDILGGDIPEYYAGIGETGSPEFENYLNLLKGDVSGAVESAAAATGRRGGVVASQTAEQVGKLSTEARFQDYLRAMQGKESLLQTGKNITEGVRGAGQSQQNQVNAFNLNAADLDFRKRLGLDDQDAAQGQALGKVLEMGLGAAAGYATTGTAAGALVGATQGIDYSDFLKAKDIDKPKDPGGGKKDMGGQIKIPKYKKLSLPEGQYV